MDLGGKMKLNKLSIILIIISIILIIIFFFSVYGFFEQQKTYQNSIESYEEGVRLHDEEENTLISLKESLANE